MGDALLVSTLPQRRHQPSRDDDTLAAMRFDREGDDGRFSVSDNGFLPETAGGTPSSPWQHTAHR